MKTKLPVKGTDIIAAHNGGVLGPKFFIFPQIPLNMSGFGKNQQIIENRQLSTKVHHKNGY